MAHESPAPLSSTDSSSKKTSSTQAKPKSRWLTSLLLLVLLVVGLVGVDRVTEGKFFGAVKDTIATTIGGGMSEQQKSSVDMLGQRLNELRVRREAIASGEADLPTESNSTSSENSETKVQTENAESSGEATATDAKAANDKTTETASELPADQKTTEEKL